MKDLNEINYYVDNFERLNDMQSKKAKESVLF